jgi:hypothetical protein
MAAPPSDAARWHRSELRHPDTKSSHHLLWRQRCPLVATTRHRKKKAEEPDVDGEQAAYGIVDD